MLKHSSVNSLQSVCTTWQAEPVKARKSVQAPNHSDSVQSAVSIMLALLTVWSYALSCVFLVAVWRQYCRSECCKATAAVDGQVSTALGGRRSRAGKQYTGAGEQYTGAGEQYTGEGEQYTGAGERHTYHTFL